MRYRLAGQHQRGPAVTALDGGLPGPRRPPPIGRTPYAKGWDGAQGRPEADRPALDIIVQAMGGIMSITGEPGGHVVRPGPSLGAWFCC